MLSKFLSALPALVTELLWTKTRRASRICWDFSTLSRKYEYQDRQRCIERSEEEERFAEDEYNREYQKVVNPRAVFSTLNYCLFSCHSRGIQYFWGKQEHPRSDKSLPGFELWNTDLFWGVHRLNTMGLSFLEFTILMSVFLWIPKFEFYSEKWQELNWKTAFVTRVCVDMAWKRCEDKWTHFSGPLRQTLVEEDIST